MELKLDTSKIYAIALEGGGAKGAYEVGVWMALEEAGVKYNAVAGTSVGALNGAMMCMRDRKTALEAWSNIRLSDVIAVDRLAQVVHTRLETEFEQLLLGRSREREKRQEKQRKEFFHRGVVVSSLG